MHLRWLDRIGVRLGLAVAVVVVLLAVGTSGLTDLAFRRSARSVEAASAEELDRLTRSSLQEVTDREAAVIATMLGQYAAASRTVAAYLGRQLERPVDAAAALSLDEASTGHWLDPDPTRLSTLHVPSSHASRAGVARDVRASAVLDDLWPDMLPELADAVSMYFVTPDGLVRYHPPIDLHRLVVPEFDVTTQPVFTLGLPAANHDRATRWVPPYLDDAGNGLLVTAVTPVYSDGAFRGVLDVDVSLRRLTARLAALAPLPGSFSFLLDDRGHLIAASPGATRHLGYVCDLTFGPCLDTPEFETMLGQVRARQPGMLSLDDREDPLVIALAPLADVGWTLSIAVPSSVLQASAHQIAAGIAGEAVAARQAIAAATLIAFVLALVGLALATQRWVARPIVALAGATLGLGTRDFAVTLPPNAPGEFRVLGEAFERTSHTLARQRREILAHQRDLEDRITRRTRELANLLAISVDMSATDDVAQLLRSVLERLRNAVPFSGAAVWLTEGDGLRRFVDVCSDPAEPRPVGLVPSAALQAHLDASAPPEPLDLAPWPPEHPLRRLAKPHAAALLLVPLHDGGRCLGVLALSDPGFAEHHQLDLVLAVGRLVASSLVNARLMSEAREHSALEERQHLARELHDSVSQALFGVVLGLHTANKEIDRRPRLQAALDYAGELAEAALKEMRALIFEMRPESLETEGLTGLLARQAEALRARHGLLVEVDAVEPALPLEVKGTLYRVAQEALHNVVKHAQASRVRVHVATGGGLVRLVIEDDGRGFAASDGSAESFGLRSMGERMVLLGGHLAVDSAPGTGTTVTATVAVVAPTDLAAGRA